MTAKERFDKISQYIEKEVNNRKKSPKDIELDVAKEMVMSPRDLSTVFNFLCGQTLDKYVNDRKMNMVCRFVVESDPYDSNRAVELSGLGEQSSLNRRFKNTYGITPKEASDKKRADLLSSPIQWEMLASMNCDEQGVGETNTSLGQLFGIDDDKYQEIKQTIELQEFFKMGKNQVSVVLFIYRNYDVSLYKAFRFVNDINRMFDDFNGESTQLEKEELVKQTAMRDIADDELRYVYFNGTMASIITAYNVIDKIHEQGEPDVTQIDIRVVDICAYDEIRVSYCMKAVEYYDKHVTNEYSEEDFDEYIDFILQNVPIETAFDDLLPLGDISELEEYACVPTEEERLEYEILAELEQSEMESDDEREYDPFFGCFDEIDSWEYYKTRPFDPNEEIEEVDEDWIGYWDEDDDDEL